MAFHSATRSVGRPSPQSSKAITLPAPIGGIDARTILSGGDPKYCVYSFNFLPGEYGLRVRKGYREWQIGLNNGSGLGVRTIVPFGGVDDDSTNDRLFAVTNEGIWNVTDDGGTPTLDVDFSIAGNGGNVSDDAGWGVYTHYTTDANEELLFYADSANGLFQYSETTETWSRPIGIIGPAMENIDFVASHKEQLWFIERDASKAWYLPIGAITGPAAEFFFGSKFKHGGNLAGLFSWSIDGGLGLDDYFVAISRSGDVLPYQGTDPSSADSWQASGQFFIGAVPKGRRFASQAGGNLKMLSAYGLISMDDLVRGVDGKDIGANTETTKIALVIRAAMDNYRNDDGWMVKAIPSQGAFLINQPKRDDDTYFQYAMNSTTTGWGLWRDVPMYCFDEWGGVVYFGTEDNRVCVMDVNADNVLITPPAAPALNGEPVKFSLLTTFQDYGEPALFKRGVFCRPDFVASTIPNVTVRFRYDYDLSEVLNNVVALFPGISLWDVGLWDAAIWNLGAAGGRSVIKGGMGMGRNIAVALSGNSRVETTFVSCDVIWNTGGPT